MKNKYLKLAKQSDQKSKFVNDETITRFYLIRRSNHKRAEISKRPRIFSVKSK